MGMYLSVKNISSSSWENKIILNNDLFPTQKHDVVNFDEHEDKTTPII